MISQVLSDFWKMTRSIATTRKTPTPMAVMIIKIQRSLPGKKREERTERSGSANVSKTPIKNPIIKRRNRDFLFVKVVPAISPILPIALSAPIEKRARPTTNGTIEMQKLTKTGPTLLNDGLSRLIADKEKFKMIINKKTGTIEIAASFNFNKNSLFPRIPISIIKGMQGSENEKS